MQKRILRGFLYTVSCILFVILIFFLLSQKKSPEHITYGISYNVPYVLELGLNPDEVFDAFLYDLGARHLRMSAHWTLIEPKKDQFDFAWMDTDIKKVEAVHGDIIFGVGRRLPRWPECHVPDWAKTLSKEEQQKEVLAYIEAVVTRYKHSPAIKYWQVENEPYLGVFAHEYCGDLDEQFLEQEIALVKKLDPTRQVLVTDSGNMGTWKGAYTHGDLFGTSVYVYFWNPELGQFKTLLPPWFYRTKDHIMKLMFGLKDTMLIELSLEPWLLEPVATVSVETQYARMNAEKFDEIIEYAKNTRYETQYVWGGEWWFWLLKHGHTDMWEKGKTLFKT